MQRRIVLAFSLLLAVAATVWVGSSLFAERFVHAVYEGEVLPYFGRLLRIHTANNPAHSGVDFYVDLVTGAGRRVFFVTGAAWLLALTLVRYHPTILTSYFDEEGSPLSLAIFRIVVFSLLLSLVDVPSLVETARKAANIRQSPPLMGWFFNHVPLGQVWVATAARLMQAACTLALIGLFSRSSALVAGLLGVYVLGIPELLGKINHGKHVLIWFALLLGASRCGDALSVDSLLWSLRNPEDLKGARPPASTIYGRPLRWAWLLIGLIFFFRGSGRSF